MTYATASAKPELLRNPLFDEWSAGSPTEWTHQSTTATTYSQLKKTDPLTAASRKVFTPGIRRSDADYIYASENGLRATLTGAAVANDWIVRQDATGGASLTARPPQRSVFRITSRCTVENNLLNVQVIALITTTDTYYLAPIGGTYYQGRTGFEWSTTATTIPLTLKKLWTTYGLEIPGYPLDADSVAVRFANGTAGAQVIDMGEASMIEHIDQLGGAG